MSSSKPFDYNTPANNSIAQIKSEAARLGLQVPPRLSKPEMLTWLLSAAGKSSPKKEASAAPVSPSPTSRKQATPSSSARTSRTPTPRVPVVASGPNRTTMQVILLVLFVISIYNPFVGPVFFAVLIYWFVQEYRYRK